MLSLLCPTRKRPYGLKRMMDSARATAKVALEFVCYVDDDDDFYDRYDWGRSCFLRGPRIVLSECWNKCANYANGDLLMMAADDMVFLTPGWDRMIEDAFTAVPDRILMVHGNDLRPWGGCEGFGVFPTIHRRWYETVGCFVPSVLVGDCPDQWLNEIADALGRRRYLPYVTEHRHPYCDDKVPVDDTYRERWQREAEDKPTDRYATLAPERDHAIEKLRALLGTTP